MNTTIHQTKQDEPSPVFLTSGPKFTIDHASISQIVKAMASTYDEAAICVDVEGLTYRSMDSTHVCLTDIRIPSAAFEKYEVNGETFATFDAKELKAILRTLDKNAGVSFNLEQKLIKVVQGSNTFELEATYERPGDVPIPRLPYDAAITWRDAKQFKAILKQCEIAGDYIQIATYENGQVVIKALIDGDTKATISKFKQELKDLSVKCDTMTTYNIQYLKAFLQTLPNASGLILEYSERKPLRIRSMINGSGVIEYYLAPRVEA